MHRAVPTPGGLLEFSGRRGGGVVCWSRRDCVVWANSQVGRYHDLCRHEIAVAMESGGRETGALDHDGLMAVFVFGWPGDQREFVCELRDGGGRFGGRGGRRMVVPVARPASGRRWEAAHVGGSRRETDNASL